MYEELSEAVGDLKMIYEKELEEAEKELEEAEKELEDNKQILKESRIEMWVWGTVTVVSSGCLVALIIAFVLGM